MKVTDFGIAQSAAGEALTEPGVVLGTVGYLSPEQVAGLPADVRSDVYSLGIVLTELLTGERPTGGEPEPTTDLERVIARARAADPSARHQVAAELRDALRVAAGTDRVAAGAPRAAHRVRRSPLGPSPSTTAATAPRRDRRRARRRCSPWPVAGAAVTAPAPRVPDPAPKRRRFRRAKTTYPKVAKTPKPVKPLKPPKPKRRRRKQQPGPPRRRRHRGPPSRPPKPTRTWKARHWAVILAAPLLVITGGALAYAKLTEHAPIVAVPDVVDTDVFAAIGTLKDAGFEVDGEGGRQPAARAARSSPSARPTARSSSRARP